VKSFIDTNVLIYWVDAGPRADVVEKLLAGDAVISVQVLNEFANVLLRKRHMPLADVTELTQTLIDVCQVFDLSVRTHQMALTLMARYKLSLYDANIVAAAGLGGCDILYTEDMQDGLNVVMPTPAGRTTFSIKNPFAPTITSG
jgi:predicted nucleic acid-binding protein